jgi:hypothetical protein
MSSNEDFMKSLHPFMRAAVCLAMGAGVSLAHAAGKPVALANPADPGAMVPSTVYRPAISYRPAPGDRRSPALNWKALNQEVGSIDSMSLTTSDMASPAAAGAHAAHQKQEAK